MQCYLWTMFAGCMWSVYYIYVFVCFSPGDCHHRRESIVPQHHDALVWVDPFVSRAAVDVTTLPSAHTHPSACLVSLKVGHQYHVLCIILCTVCWAKSLSGRTPDSQSREPGFESSLLLFWRLGIIILSTTPQLTQLYKWVHDYRQWWKCEWVVFARNFTWLECRASKSPDFVGDLPIFDKIMKISRFGMKISRFFTRDYTSTVDRQFCNSSRRNDFQFGKFCLKPFANCVVIEKHSVYGLPPQEDAIFVGTQWPHILVKVRPGFCAARDRH